MKLFLKYGVNNYKSLAIKKPLDLSNLTILSGINNTGKSAFIKSILDLKEINETKLSFVPSLQDFLTKVFLNQKKRSISYHFVLKLNKKNYADLEIKFAYSIEHETCFINEYNLKILSSTTNKVEKYLKLKKTNIEDDYKVDSLLMLDLLFGKVRTNNLPNHFKGTAFEVSFLGYHPIRINIKVEDNPLLEEYFYSDEALQFNTPEIFRLIALSKQIKYIGPIRSAPQEYYFIENKSVEIDSTGSNIIEVLNELKNKKVEFYETLEAKELTSKSLEESVIFWIKYFFGDITFNLKKISANLFKILINGNSIKNSGFGFSQLLPIIIQALLLDEEGVLLLEQPEIHLHPDLEIKLSYFLLCISRSNKQIIVETHSEHIINSLIIEKLKNEKIDSLFKIYFLERESKIAKINPIEISDIGEIRNWPDGFFDQYYKFSRELVTIRKNLMMQKRKEFIND